VLWKRLAPEHSDARTRYGLTGTPATRVFTAFDYQTQKT
jgi:hypothetical protein